MDKKQAVYRHRRYIQFMAMLIYNADIRNFFSGKISRSPLKHICVPGLNCYSCPGALSSCPLGTLQNTLGSGRFPFFITGLLLLFGTLFGRAICAFLCPFGLIQELLYKIPVKKIKRTNTSLKIARKASIIKYIFFFLLCLILPFLFYLKDGAGSPFFCSLFCPAGWLEAGVPLVLRNTILRSALGLLFTWKTAVGSIIVIWSLFVFRPFCRFFCPLGAFYSFFNKYAILGIHVDRKKCTHCGACVKSCKMGALIINDRECIRCGECRSACRFDAIK